MNFGQLRGYIEDLKASGYNVLEYEVALQRKVAFPMVTMIMTLIAVPFAVTTGGVVRCTASASGSCSRWSTGR